MPGCTVRCNACKRWRCLAECALAVEFVGDDFWGAPDLDHTNPHLREALVHWMQHLRDNIGYRGWRFDFAKVGAPTVGAGGQGVRTSLHRVAQELP